MCAQNHRWGLGPTQTCKSGPKGAVCMLQTRDESWNPYSLFILVQISLFCIHTTTGEVWYPKRLVLWCKSRCFACKNHRWGLGPIEPSNSGTNHPVVNAQNDRSCLGPIETCYSGAEVAVLQAITTGGVWDPQTLVILMLGTLFCMQKNHRWGLGPIDTSNCGHKVVVLNAQ